MGVGVGITPVGNECALGGKDCVVTAEGDGISKNGNSSGWSFGVGGTAAVVLCFALSGGNASCGALGM